MLTDNPDFWAALDALIARSELVIDRPKGSRHPRYPDVQYVLDYGYLKDTASMDGGGIDLWLGSDSARSLNAVFITVDLYKRDSEIKLLIGCTPDEREAAYRFHNTGAMRALWIERPPDR